MRRPPHKAHGMPRQPAVRRKPVLLWGLSWLPVLVASAWWLAGALASDGLAQPSLPAGDARGAALWRGALPLEGRIAGHAQALPVAASRCINCHGADAVPSVAGQAGGGVPPVLTAHHLRTPQPRRGGPPSRYDAAAFCALLRSGVDPAKVLLPRQMPRYAIDDADCRALWTHLVQGAV